jgi:hypothetical protein
MAGRCGVQREATPATYREEEAVRGDILSATLAAVRQGGAAARSVREKSRRGLGRRGSVRNSRCGAVGYDPSDSELGNGRDESGGVERSTLVVVEVTGRAGE